MDNGQERDSAALIAIKRGTTDLLRTGAEFQRADYSIHRIRSVRWHTQTMPIAVRLPDVAALAAARHYLQLSDGAAPHITVTSIIDLPARLVR